MLPGVASAFSLVKLDSEGVCFFKPVWESQMKWDREMHSEKGKEKREKSL